MRRKGEGVGERRRVGCVGRVSTARRTWGECQWSCDHGSAVWLCLQPASAAATELLQPPTPLPPSPPQRTLIVGCGSGWAGRGAASLEAAREVACAVCLPCLPCLVLPLRQKRGAARCVRLLQGERQAAGRQDEARWRRGSGGRGRHGQRPPVLTFSLSVLASTLRAPCLCTEYTISSSAWATTIGRSRRNRASRILAALEGRQLDVVDACGDRSQ